MKENTSLEQLYQEDAVLIKLCQQAERLQKKIKARKTTLARKHHIVIKSLKGIKCIEHDELLAVSGIVKGSETIIDWQGYTTDKKELKTYACADSAETVEAYDCPVCGIVLGKYSIEAYKLTSISLKQKGLIAGYFIKCSVCGTLIGFGTQGAFTEVTIK
ncbi:MAG: hypothetical protein WCQ99_00420 [Pseudomonadota bacterium]